MSWLILALLSAIFAAATSILAKIGLKSVDSNLATALRTTVIFIFIWGLVLVQGSSKQLTTLSRTNLFFIIFSGITAGLSWVFYFRALQLGSASQVASIDKLSLVLTVVFAVIFLTEKISFNVILGVGLMTVGAILLALR